MGKLKYRLYCETSGEECDGCEWQSERSLGEIPESKPVTKCGAEGLKFIRIERVEE